MCVCVPVGVRTAARVCVQGVCVQSGFVVMPVEVQVRAQLPYACMHARMPVGTYMQWIYVCAHEIQRPLCH